MVPTDDTCKNKNYDRLISSISFFSQILHVDQLSKYGYQHIHELLEVNNSSVYIKSSDNASYLLANWTGTRPSIDEIPASSALDSIATKVGHVITKDFQRYFSAEFLAEYPLEIMLPIIVKQELYGFFIANEFSTSGGKPDPEFIEAIKSLVNAAFFVGIQWEHNTKNELEMNQKLYDLLLLHQVNRLLISELDMDNLSHLCVDAVRELTASTATGFAFIDERTGRIALRSYTDIVDFSDLYLEMEWIGGDKPENMIYELEEDWPLLEQLFNTPQLFRKMKASHIILLAKDKVNGFITIGKPISGIPYDQQTLELIESIASTIMIAVENAIHVNQIKLQNKMLAASYNTLTNLNRAIKALNSSESLEELGTAVLQTLSLRCCMTEGYIAIWDEREESYTISSAIQPAQTGEKIVLTQYGANSLARGLVMDTRPDSFCNYIKEETGDILPAVTMIAPISLDMIHEQHNGLLGMIVCKGHSATIEPQWLNFTEALASSIAPTVKHLLNMQECRTTPEELFLRDLNKMEKEKKTQSLDYKVFYKKHSFPLFTRIDITPYANYRIHIIHQMILALVYSDELVDGTIFDGCLTGSIDDILLLINYLDRRK